MTDHRTRLIAFYAKYAPDKMATADSALARYVNNEAQMWQTLVNKYGAEPTHAERLLNYYRRVAPEKATAENVQAATSRYAGNEGQMWAALAGKYGDEFPAMSPRDGSFSPVPGGALSPPGAGAALSPPGMAGGGALSPGSACLSPGLGVALGGVGAFGGGPVAPQPFSLSPQPSTSPSATTDHRARLTRFYQCYSPEKLANVDAALTRYQGNEETMFATLVAKYGPEPPTNDSLAAGGGAAAAAAAAAAQRAASSASPTATSGSMRARLQRFYIVWAPQKLQDIDDILAKYGAAGEQLFAQLKTKYQCEEPEHINAHMSYRERVRQIYEKYCPEKLAGVDGIVNNYQGDEEELIWRLTRKYGAEPVGSNFFALRSALLQFYAQVDPSKLEGDTVSQICRKYENNEEALVRNLNGKYAQSGVTFSFSPSRESSISPSSFSSQQDSQQQQQQQQQRQQVRSDDRERLYRFYLYYNCSKLAGGRGVDFLDETLMRYQGRLEELFSRLTDQYGPEPPRIPPPQSEEDLNNRIIRVYRRHDTKRIQTMGMRLVDLAKAKYGCDAGNWQTGNWEDLLLDLFFKYGDHGEEAQQHQAGRPMSMRQRLIRWFKHYNKTEELDSVFLYCYQYASEPGALYAKLARTVGPEPPM